MYRANGPTGISGHPDAQALIVVLAGVVIYAFLKAQRERSGQAAAPADNPPQASAPGTGK